MTLLYPLALLGLIPWAAVAVYVWVRRREVRPTPFLRLWNAVAAPPPGRLWHRPPLLILSLLVAILLVILAATGPLLTGGGRTVEVVVDAGPTMAAAGRLASATDALDTELSRLGASRVHLRILPNTSPETPDLPALAASQRIKSTTPSPIPTTSQLTATLRRRLVETSKPVFVLTDQALPASLTSNPRLLIIPPTAPARNAGIRSFTLRDGPRPQAMLRLAGIDRPMTLTVESAGVRTTKTVSPDAAKNPIFVDLSTLGPTAHASLDAADDFPADDDAWLARARFYPRLTLSQDLPPAVRRAVTVYTKNRPATDGGATVAVSTTPPAAGPAAIFHNAPGPPMPPDSAVKMLDYPITRGLRFPPAPTSDPPPPGYRPLVTAGGKAMVAVSDGPPRRIWVGFDLAGSNWAATPDFVIFLAQAFDWAGGIDPATPDYAAADPAAVRPSWTRLTTRLFNLAPAPGLYRDGAMIRAVIVPFTAFDVTPPTAQTAVPPTAADGTDLAPYLALAALILTAAALFPRSRRAAA